MKESIYLRFMRLFSDNKYKHVPAKIGKLRIELEIADDSYKKAKGLMYRSRLQKDKGMLFIFAAERRYSFWMLNMQFGIDILWLDRNMRIVDITRGAMPAKSIFNSRNYSPSKPAMYVIETCCGFADESGIKPGNKISLELGKATL